jgi:uncharacterized protein YecE (DUF72 family)
MPIRVGEARLPGDFKRYIARFSFVEIDSEPGQIPAKARLQAAAEAAPEGFVFSLIVPSSVARLEAGANVDADWKRTQTAARVLGAKWWVVRTPASVRPTSRARSQLSELFQRLQSSGQRVAWEPGGLWEDSAAAETAHELGVHLVQDIAHQTPVPGSTLYTRVLALGRGARVGLGLAEVVAQRLQPFADAFVVVEGRGAAELQKAVAADEGLVTPHAEEGDAEEGDDEVPSSSEAELGSEA